MNNDDWNEIKLQEEKRKNSEIEETGVNFYELYNDKKKNKKKIIITKRYKILFIILLIIGILLIRYDHVRSQIISKVRRLVQLDSSLVIIPVEEKVLLNGNGYFTYKMDIDQGIVFHSYITKNKFASDLPDRFYKYYFEKFDQKKKELFEINETYEKFEDNFTNKKDWILHFSTYIDVNNYNEFINAVDVIIDTIKYMNRNSAIVNSYIRFNNELIIVCRTSEQSYEEMKNGAIEQYINIAKKYNIDINDIPEEILKKYNK